MHTFRKETVAVNKPAAQNFSEMCQGRQSSPPPSREAESGMYECAPWSGQHEALNGARAQEQLASAPSPEGASETEIPEIYGVTAKYLWNKYSY